MDTELNVDVDLVVDAPSTTVRRGYDPAEVEEFVAVTRRRLEAMATRLGQQQAEVDRLETENRSFSRSIDLAMKAAGEVMEEASAAAEAAMTEAETRAAEIVTSAEDQATATLEAARTEAHELLTVSRADAAASVADERARIEAELEMIEALQRKVAKERHALVALREQLTARLLDASRYLVEVADDPLAAGEAIIDEVLDPETDDSDDDAADAAPEFSIDEDAPEGAAFFSDDIEDDPARNWMLG